MQGKRLEELTSENHYPNIKPLTGDSFVHTGKGKMIKLRMNEHYFQRIYTNLYETNIDRCRAWFMV